VSNGRTLDTFLTRNLSMPAGALIHKDDIFLTQIKKKTTTTI